MRRHSPEPDKSGYLSQQTIAALATAVGGAIAVIRISGPRAFEALDRLTGSDTSEKSESRKMTRARLSTPAGEMLDDSIFACFRNPESFTGEDVVELHIHGGSFTASRILETLSELGVRQALPGEFSFRAVRNGKMSLSQAQAVADLIGASNEGAVTLALEKLSGSQNQLLASIGTNLRKLAVLGEVGIDFADQDVDEVSLPTLKKQLGPMIATLQQLQSSFDRGSKLQEGVGVAFVGLPNAGKSSFFNALLGEDRSIVSDIPGTTRDVIREKITLRGAQGTVTLRMEDTAGLRTSSDVIEKKGIERSHASAKSADVILFLVDPTEPEAAITAEWRELEKLTGRSLSKKALGILTKCDLLSKDLLSQRQKELKTLGIETWIQTSALTGLGISEAAQTIATHCSSLVGRSQGEVLLTRLDQVTAVTAGIEHLDRAGSAPEIDLFASDVRQALHAMGPLIGETLPDDILGQIFSDFCIGK
jgi:tRNA modification GTPase